MHRTGMVLDAEDLFEDEILYNQRLTIKDEKNDTKIYDAVTLRKLEIKN